MFVCCVKLLSYEVLKLKFYYQFLKRPFFHYHTNNNIRTQDYNNNNNNNDETIKIATKTTMEDLKSFIQENVLVTVK